MRCHHTTSWNKLNCVEKSPEWRTKWSEQPHKTQSLKSSCWKILMYRVTYHHSVHWNKDIRCSQSEKSIQMMDCMPLEEQEAYDVAFHANDVHFSHSQSLMVSVAETTVWLKGVLNALCRKSWLKSWLKSAWNKHGFFNVTGSTLPIFVIEIVIEFFRTSSACSEKFWLKSTKNQS